MSQESGENGYGVVFREYVRRSVRRALADARAAEAGLPEEQREQALQTLTFALDATDAWPEARDLLVALAPKLEQAGWRDELVPFLLRGIEVSQAAGDGAAQAELRLQLAMVYLVLGKLDAARSDLIASAAGFANLHDRRNQARALNRAAYVARLQRRFPEAKEWVVAAAVLIEPGEAEEAYGDFVTACIAIDEQDWPRAQTGFRQALARWERHGDLTMIARSVTNLGTALRGGGQTEEAAACYERAIELMQQLGDEINLATTRMNLGNVFWSTGQPAAALEQYLQVEPVFRQAHDYLRLAKITMNMGLAYVDLAAWDKALAVLEASIDYQRALGNPRGIANALDSVGTVYRAQGQHAAAEATFREALAVLDPLTGQPGVASLREEIETHLREM